MNDDVKKALEAAASAAHDTMVDPRASYALIAAAAIAAFLRALPVDGAGTDEAYWVRNLAAAVERAAKEGA